MTMLELLEESPIIAAIKSWEGLEKSLKSECKVVFVLFGTICDIDQIVARIKDAGKVAIVHVDMIQGLSTKRVAVDFIAHNTRADGIISTKNTLVERAKEMGLYAIQRTFVVDSIALDTLKKQIEMFRPDAVEIMPKPISFLYIPTIPNLRKTGTPSDSQPMAFLFFVSARHLRKRALY